MTGTALQNYFTPLSPQETEYFELQKSKPLTEEEQEVLETAGVPLSSQNHLVLSVWAEWCLACKKEMPSQKKMVPRFEKENIQLIAINKDGGEKRVKAAKELWSNLGWHPFYNHPEVDETFSVVGIPTHYLITPEKKIIAKKLGALDWESPAVLQNIQRLIELNQEWKSFQSPSPSTEER